MPAECLAITYLRLSCILQLECSYVLRGNDAIAIPTLSSGVFGEEGTRSYLASGCSARDALSCPQEKVDSDNVSLLIQVKVVRAASSLIILNDSDANRI